MVEQGANEPEAKASAGPSKRDTREWHRTLERDELGCHRSLPGPILHDYLRRERNVTARPSVRDRYEGHQRGSKSAYSWPPSMVHLKNW